MILTYNVPLWSEKTAEFLWRHHWFYREMTSEKRAQKFHTDDVSLSTSFLIGHSARKIYFNQWAVVPQTSFRGKDHLWRREMSAVFSGFFLVLSMLKHVSASIWNDSDSPEYIVARFKHAKRCSNIYHAKTSFILKTALKHKAFLQISRFIQVCESQLYAPGTRFSKVREITVPTFCIGSENTSPFKGAMSQWYCCFKSVLCWSHYLVPLPYTC